MSKDTEKEQVGGEPSSEEQVKDQPSEISGVPDALSQFQQKAQTEKSAKETDEAKAKKEEEEPCKEYSTTEKDLGVEEKTPEPSVFLVDKDGKKVPLVGKANGKTYVPDSIDKVMTWVNFGIHRKSESDELAKEKEAIEKAKPFLKMVEQAYKEGRLVIDEKRIGEPTGEKEEEKEEEEDLLVDPEVKAIKSKAEKLEKEVTEIKEKEFENLILGKKAEMDTEIDKLRDTYPLAYVENEEDETVPPRVWDTLAKHPEYDIEAAMKLSHEKMLARLLSYIEKHPEVIKGKKEEIIAEYLKEKEEREKAPISPPSSTLVDTKTGEGERTFKGARDAISKFIERKKEREKAGQKS